MIKARHTRTGKWLSDFCSGRYMDGHFRKVNLYGDPAGSDGFPLLMFANHFSWWDGFIQYRLNKSVFQRKLYVMMLEEQLRRHRVMNRCGCFSVRKNSRSVLETMRYSIDLLASPGNMVLVFPQGEITSAHSRRIEFQSGPEYLIRHIPNDFRIVFNVNLTDYGSYKKPELSVYFKTIDPGPLETPGDLARAYNDYYDQCLFEQCRRL